MRKYSRTTRLESALPHLYQNAWFVSPSESALANTVCANSFLLRTYAFFTNPVTLSSNGAQRILLEKLLIR